MYDMTKVKPGDFLDYYDELTEAIDKLETLQAKAYGVMLNDKADEVSRTIAIAKSIITGIKITYVDDNMKNM